MKYRTSRIAALILAVVLIFSVPAAASGSSAESTTHADALNSLGLFRGTENGYELDAMPTRIQGVVMLIRLLGEEEAALSSNSTNPFSDLEAWEIPYAAYAYEKGYTKGTDEGVFSPEIILDAKSYLTFVLRAMGYDDAKGDFSWDSALTDSVDFSFMSAATAQALGGAAFNRGDMVDISFSALTQPVKTGKRTLAQALVAAGVFTEAQGRSAGVYSGAVKYEYTAPVPRVSPVSHVRGSYALPSGEVTADIITVDMTNPRVKVKSAMVRNTIGATAPFSDIVTSSGGALAVINGNFFEAYEDFKKPIGHVMVNGEFLFGCTGVSSLAITSKNEVRIGTPAFFFGMQSESGKSWAMYEVNTVNKGYDASVLYTPAYGASVHIEAEGTAVSISGGKISAVTPCYEGMDMLIPADGCVMYMRPGFTSTSWYAKPIIGETIRVEPYLYAPDPEGFIYDDTVQSIISGAPRLVKDSAICNDTSPGFTGDRFTPTYSAPRTAIGTLPGNKLVLVSVDAATIGQMSELMLLHGCTDAINLDGGSSTAMYYDGWFVRSPGRELTTTLQVFVS